MNVFTLFLAQVFGPTLLIIGLGMLFNRKFYLKIFKSMDQANISVMMDIVLMIMIGMILVLNHFLWSNLPEVLISIIALGFLVKGALWALFPKFFGNISKSIASSKLLILPIVLWIFVGAYLTWIGFWV